jgi:DNA processing protein
MMHVIEKAHLDYPIRLSRVVDAPATIFVEGQIPRQSPVVALVGARAASGHGLARAHDLAMGLARRGALVISGGAVGIDAAAHVGALDGGGPTVVVLGTGLDAPYPTRHRPLFERVVERGGALVSSFQPGVPLRRWHFPRRNRVLAGLADAVVIVEASPSSGSLYTAQAARDYGRVLGACPGTAGTESLLAQGVALIESADDVYSALQGHARQISPDAPLVGSDEALALAALDYARPRDAGSVGVLAGVGSARAARALCALELEGLALSVPGGRWVKAAMADRMASPTT